METIKKDNFFIGFNNAAKENAAIIFAASFVSLENFLGVP